MEKRYWLGRKTASLELARNAASAEARLVHYELAGRYGLKALSVDSLPIEVVDALPQPIYAIGGNYSVKNPSDA